MGLKKHKEFRFAWQDAEGNLRAVVIQAEHHEQHGPPLVAPAEER